jgi:hypothetical protein
MYARDALGRLKQIKNPLGEQTLLTYGSPDGSSEGWQLVRAATAARLESELVRREPHLELPHRRSILVGANRR